MNFTQRMLTTTVLAALIAAVSAVDDRDWPVDPPRLDFDPNTTRDCTAWYDNFGSKGYTCEEIRSDFAVSPADFSRWNPSITEDCEGWETYKSYCVQVRSEWTTTPPFPGATSTSSEEDIPSAPTSETAPYGIPTWVPVGCFINNDTEAPAMEKRVTPEGGDESLTVERCQALCFEDDNNPFSAGVSEGHTCWCGDYIVGDTVDDEECDVPCAGNSSETCGGRDLIFAYRARFDLTNPDLASPSTSSVDITTSAESAIPTRTAGDEEASAEATTSGEGVLSTGAAEGEEDDADSAASVVAGAWLYGGVILQLGVAFHWFL